MSKEDAIEVMAVVIEPLPNAMFKVELAFRPASCRFLKLPRADFSPREGERLHLYRYTIRPRVRS